MSRPTDQQITDSVRAIRRLNLDGHQADWPELERRLKRHLKRDASGSSDADGYPTSTLPEGGGGSGLTSVEAGAEARLAGREDRVHHHLEQAIGNLVEAQLNVGALVNHLAKIDDIINEPPKTLRLCQSHARIPGTTIGGDHWGTVGGRLAEHHALCRPCYDVVLNHNRLPTLAELNHHIDTGRFQIDDHTTQVSNTG